MPLALEWFSRTNGSSFLACHGEGRSPQISQVYMDMALAIQQVTEEIVMKLCRTAAKLTKSKYLVLAGGVALNCVANGKLLRSGIFEDLWIQPAAGDAGGALGAAYAVWYFGKAIRGSSTVVPTPCTARISDHRFQTGRLSESLAVMEQFPPIMRALMSWQNL